MAEQEKEWQEPDWEGVRNVLVIMAHPDDPDISCGGTAIQMARAGINVHYMILTNGDKGNHDPEITHNQLVLMRQEEQRNAARISGVQQVLFMNEEDGFLTPSRALRARVTRIIRTLKPEIIICPSPDLYFSGRGYINHPDHRNAGIVALEAIFPAADNMMFFPEMLNEGFLPHKIQQLYITSFDQGDTRVNVTDVIKTKIDAILCHKSQFGAREKQAMRRWMERWGEENEDGTRTHWEKFQVLKFAPRRTDEEEEESAEAEKDE